MARRAAAGAAGRPLRIWVVSEGHAGHTNQSLGLADALGRLRPVATEVVEAPMTLRGGWRPLLRAFLRTGLPAGEGLLRACYAFAGLPAGRPDLIISSGGKSVPFARVLARKLHSRYAFCGPPAPYPPAWFDLILSPLPGPGDDRFVLTDLLLSRVTPEGVADAARAAFGDLSRPEGIRLGAVLVGGASRSCPFSDEDWRLFATGLNRMARAGGWRWLLTTSRRTGERPEEILRAELDPATLYDAAWFQRTPRRVVAAYLGAAEGVLVTRDSLTMVSEALASGRPTVAIAPVVTRPSAYLDTVLDRQAACRRLAILTCAETAAAGDHFGALRPPRRTPAQTGAERLLELLGEHLPVTRPGPEAG